jgi:hypothetical protein
MFVSSKIHQQALTELAAERAKRELLTRQCDSQLAFLEFLAQQLNQAQLERRVLMKQVTGVDVPIPEITVAPPHADASDRANGTPVSQYVFHDLDREQSEIVP